MEMVSSLFCIQDVPKDPIDLFKRFTKEYIKYTGFERITMNLATVNSQNEPASRTVVYRGLLNSNIIFVTERNSMKYKELMRNPRVALTFIFTYKTPDDEISQQVRIRGKVTELSEGCRDELWSEEPTYAKVRSYICNCGEPTKWEDLKLKHDELCKKFESGEEQLLRTESYTAFQVEVDWMDFYHSGKNAIADRVAYTRSAEAWNMEHLCA